MSNHKFHPDNEYLKQRIEALEKELKKKNVQIADQERLISYYERLNKAKPKKVQYPEHSFKYPECNNPLKTVINN